MQRSAIILTAPQFVLVGVFESPSIDFYNCGFRIAELVALQGDFVSEFERAGIVPHERRLDDSPIRVVQPGSHLEDDRVSVLRCHLQERRRREESSANA